MAVTDLAVRAADRVRLHRATGPALLAGATLVALATPGLLFESQLRIADFVLMFVALASAWNLVGGLTGYPCFGQVGFFGIGVYTTAVLMSGPRLSFWVSILASTLIAGAFAALVGLPLLRLKGHYFAIATLGVAEGLRELVVNWTSLTGGGAGISVPISAGAPTGYFGATGFYLLFLGLAVLVVAVALAVSRSRAGLALRAIHQDEDAAGSMGINTTVAKTAVFALSAALTGAVGSAYGFQQVTVYPERPFDVVFTELMVIMVILGGAGTVLGPVLGALSFGLLEEWLRDRFADIHPFILGGVIVLAVVLLPQGLVNYVSDGRRTGTFSLLDNVRRNRL